MNRKGSKTRERRMTTRALAWGSGIVLLATLVSFTTAADTKRDLSLFDWPMFGQNASRLSRPAVRSTRTRIPPESGPGDGRRSAGWA